MQGDRPGKNLFHHLWPAHDCWRRDRLREGGQHGLDRRRRDLGHRAHRGGVFIAHKRGVGLVIAGLVSIALAVRFIPAFMNTGKMMPAGLMAILSAIGVVMTIVAWIKK